MTEALTLTLWLLLAVVQQHGTLALTFRTQEDCQEARGTLMPAAETVALSECVTLTLVRLREGEPVQGPRRAP